MTDDENKTPQEPKPTIRKATTGAWWKSVSATPRKKTTPEKKVPSSPPAPLSLPVEQEGEQQEAFTVPDNAEPDIFTPAPAAPAIETATKAEATKERSADSIETTDSGVQTSEQPSPPPAIEAEKNVEETKKQAVVDNKVADSDISITEPTSISPTIEEENSQQETKDPIAEDKQSVDPGTTNTQLSSADQTLKAEKKNDQTKDPIADDSDILEFDVITTETELSVALEEKAEKTSPRKPSRSKQGRGRKEKRVEKEQSIPPEPTVSAKLLINAEEPEECRIALIEEGRLESYHVTTVSRERTKNNIYKGTIVSIEPNLQVAFVDIGTGRNGFLPFSEIHPEYFRQDVSEQNRRLIAQHQWKKLKIEDVVKKGQEVLVQVVKEVTGNKGANITTYLSLPGRFLVLMPGSDSAGISRKITGEERRSNLRQIMSSFTIPEGVGYIIRTASVDITKIGLQKDLRFLLLQWEDIKRLGQTKNAPALIYEDEDTVTRFLRDHFSPAIKEITVDTDQSYERVTNFVKLLPVKQKDVKIKMHRGAKPIFNQLNIEEQIESIFKPQVALPSGGSIVIDPTEALVAIDVNSGRTSKNADFEETIFLANMEAAAELARQLRLRDLGGLIVVDFIDMRNKKHIREVEKQVRTSMKRDKAKVDTSKISRFGLMQISRQKMGAPVEKASYKTCPHCQGRGVVRSVETQALYYLRRIQTGISRKKVDKVECRLPLEVAQYLLNKKRNELCELELKHSALIDILPIVEMRPNDNQIDFVKNKQNVDNEN
ncbi:Rne/Rng family ribonuclease [Desulfogranum marinum]|uniref:Rne/Rng family ribonuclease n=1 Tax=Desulfogranum marinum TaxID=453220 RepID=UPI001963120F|nr:Rne/Rng family ribonuclease [Desulfogranum marinum]MBM9512005.1 Rne/Rng family ribonuclease [Desulfogranum marinum]